MKVAFLKFGFKNFIPVKNRLAVFAHCGLLDELFSKISHPSLKSPVDLIPQDPSWHSFHTLWSFLLLRYAALKMTSL